MVWNRDATASRFDDAAWLLVRIMVGLLFAGHGIQKLFGFPVPSLWGIAKPLSFMGVAGTIELITGAMMVLGFGTRLVCFLASGMMAVAYFSVHAGRSFYPIQNGGELAVIFSFIMLAMAARGAGRFSVDEVWKRRSMA